MCYSLWESEESFGYVETVIKGDCKLSDIDLGLKFKSFGRTARAFITQPSFQTGMCAHMLVYMYACMYVYMCYFLQVTSFWTSLFISSVSFREQTIFK